MTPDGRGRLYSAEAQRPDRPGAWPQLERGWADGRRGTPTSRASGPETKSAGVFLPDQIGMVPQMMCGVGLDVVEVARCYDLVAPPSKTGMLE
jgi:hypothetical protein